MGQEKENYSKIDLSESFDNSNVKIQEGTRVSQNYFHSKTPKIIRWIIKYSGIYPANEPPRLR